MLWIVGGRIADLAPREGALRVDGALITGRTTLLRVKAQTMKATGLLIVPAFIDAHVHLAVPGDRWQAARDEVRRGVAGVLDLGTPELEVPDDVAPLRTRWSGPLFTAPGGYPTQSWGKRGFGLEVESAGEARAAVGRLAAKEARFVKLAFDPRWPMLDPGIARAVSDEAHRLGLKVAAHALEADAVRRALDAGADVLAHTPRDPLPPDLLDRLRGKWVISTLHAFGVAPERLAALREAGMRVAYGTDLGNEDTRPGIDARELLLLEKAGVDPLQAATHDAADLLGLRDVGRLSVGSAASLLAVRGLDPESLARPVWVMNCGKLVV